MRQNYLKAITTFFAGVCLFTSAKAVEISDLTDLKLNEVLSQVDSMKSRLEYLFTEEFNEKVSPDQLRKIILDNIAQPNKCKIEGSANIENTNAKSYLLLCGNEIIPVDVSIEPKPPYLINGFFIGRKYKKISLNYKLNLGKYDSIEAMNIALNSRCDLPNSIEFRNWYIDHGNYLINNQSKKIFF
ncbi:hypothetical protein [Comamonas thiooxydans]|uniref:hypothetical protein n=1 Tax=Comamonas thiooxydans TaxID=363952 RepID=UPI001CCDF212|nr:hypothetical protein [Comamonas thiooxydans]MCO8250041.1 hypothetical protein [Comamonas thiooxydans]UBQ44024.1 hypothetical protein LCH15_11395 [Comamonas thiooxydans]